MFMLGSQIGVLDSHLYIRKAITYWCQVIIASSARFTIVLRCA